MSYGSGRPISSDLEELPSNITDRTVAIAPGLSTGVFVFESTPMACDLLSHALDWPEDDLVVVGAATGVCEGVLAKAAEADVVLVSLELDEGPREGLTLVRRIVKQNDSARCVVMMDRAERALVVDAFRAGAVGVYGRSQPAAMLWKCIRSVSMGQIWANSQQLRYVLDALTSRAPTRISGAKGELLLTPREDEIASLVAEGLKNREIAEKLRISENTVKNHVFHIFEKLGISTRAELILYLT